MSQISKQKKISLKTLKRWVESYQKGGKVPDKPRKGRPTQLTKDDNRYIRDKLKKGKKSTKDVRIMLEKKGLKVDKSTVCRHAKLGKAGLVYRAATKKPLVTRAMKSKIFQFSKEN